MFAAAIDQSGAGSAAHDFEAAALQGKPVSRKIPDGGREIQLSSEPGLHGVLVGGDDIGEVPRLERPQMGVDKLLGQNGLIVPVRGSDLPARVDAE